MKQEKFPLSVPTATHHFQKITVPKGFIQYIKYTYTDLRAANQYYLNGLSIKKRITAFAPNPNTGGIVLFNKEQLHISTNGGGESKNYFEYQLRNWEFKEATDLWVYCYHNIGSTQKVNVMISYSENKLEEVV